MLGKEALHVSGVVGDFNGCFCANRPVKQAYLVRCLPRVFSASVASDSQLSPGYIQQVELSATALLPNTRIVKQAHDIPQFTG